DPGHPAEGFFDCQPRSTTGPANPSRGSHGAKDSAQVCSVCCTSPKMTPKYSLAVDPFLLQALDLLDRISSGQEPNPHEERVRLRAILDQGEAIVGRGREWQLSSYALVAWVDEMLVEASWTHREWWSN